VIVIVTGGRDYAGTGLVEALDEVLAKHPGLVLYVGDARGADARARAWAESRGVPCREFAANWSLGPAAGPTRNAIMVSSAANFARMDPALCLAAPGGRGTADCVERCRKAGIEVREVKS